MYVQSSDTTAANWSKRIYSTTHWNTNSTPGSVGPISGYWPGISLLGYAWQGMTVYKAGRTTGVTYGTVAATCEYPMLDSLTTPKVALCAARATGLSFGPGDSGGPVFYPAAQSDPPYAIGMMFGGSGNTFNGNDQCTSNCQIVFYDFLTIQTHLSRYFSP